MYDDLQFKNVPYFERKYIAPYCETFYTDSTGNRVPDTVRYISNRLTIICIKTDNFYLSHLLDLAI